MREVIINMPFKDAYTGELYAVGKTYPMTEERIEEVKNVNPRFVTVVESATEEAPVPEEIPVPEKKAKGGKRK